MSQIHDDFAPYMDANGYVNPTSSNTIRATSEYRLAIGAHCDMLDDEEFEMIDGQYVDAMQALEIFPGLYKRTLTSPDQEGPDDYIALINANWSQELAYDIYLWGQRKTPLRGLFTSPILKFLFGWIKVKYNYNNVIPDMVNRSSWLGRQTQVRAHIKWGADVKPSLFERLYWASVIAFSGKSGDQDSWALSWHLIQCMAGRCWIGNLAVKLWKKRFAVAYPGGIKQVFAEYYGADHPLAKWSVDV